MSTFWMFYEHLTKRIDEDENSKKPTAPCFNPYGYRTHGQDRQTGSKTIYDAQCVHSIYFERCAWECKAITLWINSIFCRSDILSLSQDKPEIFSCVILIEIAWHKRPLFTLKAFCSNSSWFQDFCGFERGMSGNVHKCLVFDFFCELNIGKSLMGQFLQFGHVCLFFPMVCIFKIPRP